MAGCSGPTCRAAEAPAAFVRAAELLRGSAASTQHKQTLISRRSPAFSEAFFSFNHASTLLWHPLQPYRWGSNMWPLSAVESVYYFHNIIRDHNSRTNNDIQRDIRSIYCYFDFNCRSSSKQNNGNNHVIHSLNIQHSFIKNKSYMGIFCIDCFYLFI